MSTGPIDMIMCSYSIKRHFWHKRSFIKSFELYQHTLKVSSYLLCIQSCSQVIQGYVVKYNSKYIYNIVNII